MSTLAFLRYNPLILPYHFVDCPWWGRPTTVAYCILLHHCSWLRWYHLGLHLRCSVLIFLFLTYRSQCWLVLTTGATDDRLWRFMTAIVNACEWIDRLDVAVSCVLQILLLSAGTERLGLFGEVRFVGRLLVFFFDSWGCLTIRFLIIV